MTHPGAVWVERLLIVLGVVCLGWYGVTRMEAARLQADQAVVLDQLISATEAARSEPGNVLPEGPFGDSVEPSLIGRLDVPRLHLSVMVMGGDDDRTLDMAAGHLPDTPLPWQPGNSAIAAHRDSYFRPLKGIRLNDRMRLTTPRGVLEYEVTRTQIVKPEDVWVLESSGEPSMTLITCYPFAYIGNAPERFIVQARRLDRAPGVGSFGPLIASPSN